MQLTDIDRKKVQEKEGKYLVYNKLIVYNGYRCLKK